MPALDNIKHELFAQGLAKGYSQVKAYAEAGYKPNDGASARLAGNVRIKARIAELVEKTTEKVIENVSWDAKDLFARMNSLIERAAAAGDYKAAIDGSKFVLRCFGYEDAPTLTNEDVRGRQIPVQAAHRDGDEQRKDGGVEAPKASITHITEALKKYQRRGA